MQPLHGSMKRWAWSEHGFAPCSHPRDTCPPTSLLWNQQHRNGRERGNMRIKEVSKRAARRGRGLTAATCRGRLKEWEQFNPRTFSDRKKGWVHQRSPGDDLLSLLTAGETYSASMAGKAAQVQEEQKPECGQQVWAILSKGHISVPLLSHSGSTKLTPSVCPSPSHMRGVLQKHLRAPGCFSNSRRNTLSC